MHRNPPLVHLAGPRTLYSRARSDPSAREHGGHYSSGFAFILYSWGEIFSGGVSPSLFAALKDAFLKKIFIYLFIFVCVGSLLLHMGFL